MPPPVHLLLPLLLLVGCAATIPVVPPGARGQQPSSGSPNCAWIAHSGRIEVVTGAQRISANAHVQRQSDGQIRLGIVSDDGELLADLIAQVGKLQLVQAQPALASVAPALAHALTQAWAAPGDKAQWVDGWIVGRAGDSERYYGGDPLVLRRVSGAGHEVSIEDYRWESFGLLAHEVRGHGAYGSFRLALGVVELPPAATLMPGVTEPLSAPDERW